MFVPRHPKDKCLVAQSCKTDDDDRVLQWQWRAWRSGVAHIYYYNYDYMWWLGWAQGSQILQSVYKWAAIKLYY